MGDSEQVCDGVQQEGLKERGNLRWPTGTPEPAFSGEGQADWDMNIEEGGAEHFSLFSGFQIFRKYPNLKVSMKKESCRVGCPPLASLRKGLWFPQLCLSRYCLT